jgi:CheY-like chemotaxis protein
MEKTSFDLAQVIQSRISLMGVLAHQKGLSLEAEVDPNLPGSLRGDSDKIGQILMNLLNNAIKFTEVGKIRVTAKPVDTTGAVCRVRISVQDTGIGIVAEDRAKLFEPFEQADASTARRFGGTGLGLSICKRYVEMMGGEIGCASQPGAGSEFWFVLPLEVMRSEEKMKSPPKPVVLDRPGRRSLRILVAEDNHLNQVIVANMLGVLGHSVEMAANGREAIEKFNQHRPDLILMDLHMPLIDGLEAGAEIRHLEGGLNRTPILAFTATVIQENERARFGEVMDGFLLKPVTLEQLETVLAPWSGKPN